MRKLYGYARGQEHTDALPCGSADQSVLPDISESAVVWAVFVRLPVSFFISDKFPCHEICGCIMEKNCSRFYSRISGGRNAAV